MVGTPKTRCQTDYSTQPSRVMVLTYLLYPTENTVFCRPVRGVPEIVIVLRLLRPLVTVYFRPAGKFGAIRPFTVVVQVHVTGVIACPTVSEIAVLLHVQGYSS